MIYCQIGSYQIGSDHIKSDQIGSYQARSDHCIDHTHAFHRYGSATCARISDQIRSEKIRSVKIRPDKITVEIEDIIFTDLHKTCICARFHGASLRDLNSTCTRFRSDDLEYRVLAYYHSRARVCMHAAMVLYKQSDLYTRAVFCMKESRNILSLLAVMTKTEPVLVFQLWGNVGPALNPTLRVLYVRQYNRELKT